MAGHGSKFCRQPLLIFTGLTDGGKNFLSAFPTLVRSHAHDVGNISNSHKFYWGAPWYPYCALRSSSVPPNLGSACYCIHSIIAGTVVYFSAFPYTDQIPDPHTPRMGGARLSIAYGISRTPRAYSESKSTSSSFVFDQRRKIEDEDENEGVTATGRERA